jgi:hypothetical protein
MRLAGGLLLALASTFALNWGFFMQHRASNTLPRLSLRRPLHSLLLLFRDARWLLGYAVGMLGWGLYIVALVLAPISLVQTVSAGGIGVLALLVWRAEHALLPARDGAAIAACLAGLALLCISFGAGVPAPAPAGRNGVLVWVGVTAGLAAVAWLAGGRMLRAGAGLGAAAGLLYAAGDVSTKGAVIAGLVFVPMLIACHVLGFVALQLAYQRGTALATAGLSTLLNNSVPIVAGVLAFGERLPGGAFGAARLVSFALVVAGAALLARPEAPARTGGSDLPAAPPEGVRTR